MTGSSGQSARSAYERPHTVQGHKLHQAVMFDHTLNSCQKHVMHVLLQTLDWKTWRGSVSNAALAERVGMSARSVQRALNGHKAQPGLIDGFGYVVRERVFFGGEEKRSTLALDTARILSKPVLPATNPMDDELDVFETCQAGAHYAALRKVSDSAFEQQPDLAELHVRQGVPRTLR